MRYKLLFLSLLFAFSVSAQTEGFVEKIQRSQPGEGIVVIHQTSSIAALLEPSLTLDEGIRRNVHGYRIQIFSGNNQSNSKREASDREAALLIDFPDLKTYISYKSPFWRLRVGNYTNFEEADLMMRKIKKINYYFVKEMFVVKDEIEVE